MVQPDDVLLTTAEVAIAVAGFSGVVAALAPRSQRAWPVGARQMLSTLLLSSGAIVAFSFLPLVILVGTDGVFVWPLASAIHAVYLFAIFALRLRQYLADEAARGSRETRLVGIAPAIFMSAAALQTANAVFLRAAWPYVAAMVLSTVAAFLVFAVILHLFWSQEN